MKDPRPSIPLMGETRDNPYTAWNPTRRRRYRRRHDPQACHLPAFVWVAVIALAATFNVAANTYVVSTAAAFGAGSLADAINLANANPGPDVIVFTATILPAKIVPIGPLPDIVDSVVIDATTPPNCPITYKPLVELDGSLAGLNVNGLTALGTAVQPIGVTIKGFAIHSFSGAGIMLQRNTNSVIQGNYLGTDPSGVMAFPNGRGLVLDTCTNVIVGGIQPCERNVVSGNLGDGIVVANGEENRVVGNWVGLAANGLWPMGNGVGVSLFGCTRCQIGSLSPGEGNVISRNHQAGVQVNGGLFVPMDTHIEGNFIGTLTDGASPAGNNGEGIFFFGGPTKNTVRGNVIAWNGAQGVSVLEGIDNTIVENSIYNNGGLGIDITPVGGPNPNDPCDPDTGPNRQQNYPILTAAMDLGGTLQVDGDLDSEPGLTFRLDFYWSPLCDPFGFGEGKHYIGQATVSGTAAGCVNPFSFSFPVAVPIGTMITATATHPEGSTSEFSPCLSVVGLGTNIINHAGLPHQPLGGATLTETNGWLDVSLFNGGGSNGVRVALGRAEGWQAALDSFELLPGDSYQLSVLQDAVALNPQPLPPRLVPLAAASLSVGANGLTFRGNFTPGGSNQPMNLRLEFRDDQDQLVSVVRFPNGGEYDLPPCTNIYQQYIVCSNAYVSLHSGEPAFCWKFCHVTCIPPGPYGGPPVFKPVLLASSACLIAEVPWRRNDNCILCPKVDVGTNQFAGTIDITANLGQGRADGGHLRLGAEWLQQFGQFHQAVSNANLTGWAQAGGAGALESLGITIPSMPEVGPGGGCVALMLDRARYICVGWDPAVLAGSGSMPYKFGLIVGTNHISDSTVIQSSANGANISFGFPASGSATGRLDFYLAGQPVGSMNALTSTVLLASSAPMRAAAATSPFTPVGTRGFGLYWPDAVSFILVLMPGFPALDTGQPIQADELRITPVNPSNPLPWLTHLTIEADGLPGFEVSGEDARPAVPGPLQILASQGGVLLSYPTEAGRPCQLQFTSQLPAPAWQILDDFLGDGSVRAVFDQVVPGRTRFYQLVAP